MKSRLIRLARPLAISATDSLIHTPAAVDGSMFAEEVFECRPQIGCEGADYEIHRWSLVLIDFNRNFCFTPTHVDTPFI
jgi:hypothetical protein